MARYIDVRVVQEPMDYVSARLCLERMPPGEDLDIVTHDESSARRLAEEIRADGNDVLSAQPGDEGFVLRVRKGVSGEATDYTI